MSTKRPSLKDVASMAGVGLGTASRVLNNSPSVKPATRDKVMSAIDKLNYRPNNVARSLKTNATNSVGILLADLKSGFDTEIIRGIEQIAERTNYSLFLTNTNKEKNKVIRCLKNFVEKNVDGIIIIGGEINEEFYSDIKDFQIPLITISCVTNITPKGKFASIAIDNEQASFEAVSYLINAGHKNIAMISGEKDEPNAGIPRINGYKKALEKNGLEVNEDYIVEGSYTYFSGYDSANVILEFKDRPTAIFIASDAMSIGAQKAILEAGLKIPEDIAIIGFDGLDFTEFVHPSITTVSQPRYKMGTLAMETLLNFIENETIVSSNFTVEHKLIVRESC